LAAGLTTAAIALLILVPAAGISSLAVVEGSALLTQLDASTLKERLATLRRNLDLEVPQAEEIRETESLLNELLSGAAPQPSAVAAFRGRVERLLQRLKEAEATGDGKTRSVQAEAESLRAALQQLTADTPGSLQFEGTLQGAVRDFRDLKMVLFGGPYKAWLVDLANPSDRQIRDWSGQVFSRVRTWLLSVGGATTAFAGNLFLGIFIMLVGTYFFLADGPEMIQALMRLSPLDNRYEQELLEEFGRISRAVVLATVLAALAQGLLAGIGYWLVGLDYALLLTLLSIVAALIPFFGASIIWFPAAAWLLLYEGRPWAAGFLVVYGVGVVSMVDNLIKPAVLHGRSHLHPLLAFLSVLGGLQALGPIGILVGPMVVAFLQTLLNILHRELAAMDSAGVSPAKPSGT